MQIHSDNSQTSKKKWGWVLILGIVILLLSGMWMMRSYKKQGVQQVTEKTSPVSEKRSHNQTSYTEGAAATAIEKKPDINFQSLATDASLDELMTKRKEKLGVTDSLDMIVQEDEQFTVGDKKISMQEILQKIHTSKGEVYEETISQTGFVTPESRKEYGIYVVRPKDNIWNIHFRVLKDYFAARNIPLSPSADEPKTDGSSSGIGKILKFSEGVVAIYHLKENRLVKNINIIEPLSKIIIYNMSDIFSLLEEVNYENVNRIEFDGTNIWIPATTKFENE